MQLVFSAVYGVLASHLCGVLAMRGSKQVLWAVNYKPTTAELMLIIWELCVCVQRKCDQYWPSEGEQTYDGGLTVHLLSTNVTAHYTVRMFSVRSPVKTLRKAQTCRYCHGLPNQSYFDDENWHQRNGIAKMRQLHCSVDMYRLTTGQYESSLLDMALCDAYITCRSICSDSTDFLCQNVTT